MAERVQQVKGPGARPPRGVKPQVKNPMKIFTRIMKYALKDYTVHCIAVVIAYFCQRPGKCTGNDVYENAD